MARFEKTSLSVASAVLLLLGLYALAGLGYALWMRSSESAIVWAVVAGLGFTVSYAYQRYVRSRRRRAG